jgi:hypothetical protein
MKKLLLLLSLIGIIIIAIVACNTTKTKTILQKPGDVTPDEYSINIEADTILVTKNGAILKIPKGSIASDGSSNVTLEIKEAYSLEQMMKSGLTTKANGELLSSGGMIYINAKGGQNVTIKQAIKVALPADYLNPDMKLFKGESDQEGNINWTNPTPLSENKQVKEIVSGKQLFMSNCASCHTIGKDLTGPDLAHFLKRFQGDKLLVRGHTLHFPYFGEEGFNLSDTSNFKKDTPFRKKILSDKLWANQELYFCNMKSMYGSIGTQFPDINEEALNSIYRYIQNESDEKKLPLPSIAYLDGCIDSCMAYRNQTRDLQQQKELQTAKQKKLLNEKNKLVEEKKDDAVINTTPTTGTGASNPRPDDGKVAPKQYESVYYQFSIETFGWYNIDVLMKGQNGVAESELFVRLTGEYRQSAQVYLIIPSSKVYVQGGPAERNPEEFAFMYRNGKIDLPQGATAYIMAVTETKSSIAWSLKTFTTTTRQEFEMAMQETTKEVFNAALSGIGDKDLKISVKDSKNADEIRKTNSSLEEINQELKKTENLKPKNCDCDCGYPETDAIKIIDEGSN